MTFIDLTCIKVTISFYWLISRISIVSNILVRIIKGHLISKGLSGFFNSPKKNEKKICPGSLGQKLTFSSSFLGELKTPKFSFEIN